MILLSYPLSIQTPIYGNGEEVQIQFDSQIARGDSCNTLNIGFSNHAGTHLDCPFHFDETGTKLTNYPEEFWMCQNIQILRADLAEKELCHLSHLEKAYKQAEVKKPEAEMVLLITQWYQRRDETCYWQTPPGFVPETAHWLRERFPRIRFFGFDLISLSSYAHREIGKKAHKSFLCDESPVLIIEDMDLSPLEKISEVNNVLVSPLFVHDADGAPCTIWGNI
jgi:arylformamidase